MYVSVQAQEKYSGGDREGSRVAQGNYCNFKSESHIYIYMWMALHHVAAGPLRIMKNKNL